MAIPPSITKTVTTMVTDAKFSKFMKFILDIIERVRKGSLNPDAVMNAIRPLIGQVKVGLSSLSAPLALVDLTKRQYFYGFFESIEKFSGGMAEPSGKTLVMPNPKPLGKVTTEREILRQFPGCSDLDGQELIEEAKKLVPSFKTLFGNLVNTIVECEEGRSSVIPTTVGTWTLGFCVHEGVLQILRWGRFSDGWSVSCRLVGLGDEWSAGHLLLIAMDPSTP